MDMDREAFKAQRMEWDSSQWHARHGRASLYMTPDEIAEVVRAIRAERRAFGRSPPMGSTEWSRKRRWTRAITLLDEKDRIPHGMVEGGDCPALQELQRRLRAAEDAARAKAEEEYRAWLQTDEAYEAYLEERARVQEYLRNPAARMLPMGRREQA
jgi:hypothetical protein